MRHSNFNIAELIQAVQGSSDSMDGIVEDKYPGMNWMSDMTEEELKYFDSRAEFIGPNSPYMALAKKMDRMKTPWFLASEIFHTYREDLIETITINEYDFTKDGKITS